MDRERTDTRRAAEEAALLHGPSRLAQARERLATAKVIVSAASVALFCGALLFARASSAPVNAPSGELTSAASPGDLTAPGSGAGFSQGAMSSSFAAPQGRSGVS